MRICAIEFSERIAASINGTARQIYEKGSTVVVPESERYAVMRLWWKVVSTWVLSFKWWELQYEIDKDNKTIDKDNKTTATPKKTSKK